MAKAYKYGLMVLGMMDNGRKITQMVMADLFKIQLI